MSLISKLHVNRVLLHRKEFWHPYGCNETVQIETEKKVNSAEYILIHRNLEMVVLKKRLIPCFPLILCMSDVSLVLLQFQTYLSVLQNFTCQSVQVFFVQTIESLRSNCNESLQYV